MNDRAAPTLFQQALGAAYYSLAPCVRRLHGIRGQARYVGVATIECGNNPLARICARIAGLPAEARDAATRVEFIADGHGETWRRDFAGQKMASALQYRDGLLCERLGPLRFRYFLHAREGALWWQVAGVTLSGFLPLPARLFDGVRCRERECEGRYEFMVEAQLPLVGRIIRYEGWLLPEADAQA